MPASRTRIKTVELIVEKKQLPSTKHVIKETQIVPLQIAYGEKELRKQIRSLGGRWDSEVKLWYAEYGKIKGTELEKHIIPDTYNCSIMSYISIVADMAIYNII